MTIACTLLSGVGYGGATYFRNILPALAMVAPHDTFHCFVQEHHPLPADVHAPNVVFHAVLPVTAGAVERFRYEQLVLPRALAGIGADLVYTAKNITIFRAPCPQVIAIRNMEPFRYRTFANSRTLDAASRVKWELTKRSIRAAAGIVVVSEAVRDAVVGQFPEAAGKVSVVYNGNPIRVYPEEAEGRRRISRDGHPEDSSTVAQVGETLRFTQGKLNTPPFLLTASKFVAYANQLTLVEAYALLLRERPDAPELHFVGGVHDRAYFARVQHRIRALGIGHRVRMLGLLPQDDLHARMRQAITFVFPSMLESCPHTLLEAMACGVPITASDIPPMPELCGDAALYVDPRNPTTIMRTIARLLDDAVLRDRLITAGRERVQQFTWEKTARGLLDVFARVGDRQKIGNRQS